MSKESRGCLCRQRIQGLNCARKETVGKDILEYLEIVIENSCNLSEY